MSEILSQNCFLKAFKVSILIFLPVYLTETLPRIVMCSKNVCKRSLLFFPTKTNLL